MIEVLPALDLDDETRIDALIIALTAPECQHLPGAGLIDPPRGLAPRRAARDALCRCGVILTRIADRSIALHAYAHADRCLGLTTAQWGEACALATTIPNTTDDARCFAYRCQLRRQRTENRF